MTRLRSGSATHVGRVRSINQDIALETSDLFAVADGMGGHVGGEVAARVAVDALQSAFAGQRTLQGLQRAVSAANAAVWEQSQNHMDLRGMGTTLTALALVTDRAGAEVVALANVGDSRAYLFSEGKLAQITDDHSLAEEKVRQGELTEAEAAIHPHRHILTRALGVGSTVAVDLWELHMRSGDRVLICSDGLTNEVSAPEIAEVLAAIEDPAEAAKVLVDEANQHGGNDNITVVVVDVIVGDAAADAGTAGFGAVAVGGPSMGAAGAGAPGLAPASTAAMAAGALAADRDPDSDMTAAYPAVRSDATAGSETPDRAIDTEDPHNGEDYETQYDDDTQYDDTQYDDTQYDDTQYDDTDDAVNDDTQYDAAADSDAGPGGPDHTAALAAGGLAAGALAGAALAAGDSSTGAGATGSDFEGARTPGAPALAPKSKSKRKGRPADQPRLAPNGKRETRRQRRRRLGIPRRITFRVLFFLMLVAGVFVGGYYFVRWYANDNWYVTLKGKQLVVYQGRPGGLLWYHPKMVDRSGVTTDEILPVHLPALRADVQETSLHNARGYIAGLVGEYQAYSTSTLTEPGGVGPSGTVPTTTTTKPKVVTTLAPYRSTTTKPVTSTSAAAPPPPPTSTTTTTKPTTPTSTTTTVKSTTTTTT